MTTDTFQKGAVRTARIGDAEVTIAGIAKGSGMIAPDMATMLVFMFTDAAIPAPVLQTLPGRTANRSFNVITLDGHHHSKERRVGKECVSTCRYGSSPNH